MTVEVDRLLVSLEARVGPYMKGIADAQKETNRNLGLIEKKFASTERNARASIGSMGAMLGGIGAYLSIDQLTSYADAWTRVTRAIAATEQLFGIALISAEDLADMATRTRSDIEALSKLYLRAGDAVARSGGSAQDAADATETYAKALKLGQASATEAKAATEQFAQALTKGFLNGDELRSQMELAAVVVHALAEQMGVTKGQLIELGEQGKISSSHMINALKKVKPVVDQEFSRMPQTVDEAFTNLRTAMIKYVGHANEARGVTAAFSGALQGVANNMERVADVAAVLGAALLATFGRGAAGGVLAVASRLASLPALAIGAAAAIETMGDEVKFNFDLMKQAADQGADWGTALAVGMRDAANSGVTLQDQFHGLYSVLGDDLLGVVNDLSAALGGQEVDWSDVSVAALTSIGAIIGGIKALYHLFKASFEVLPLTAESAFMEVSNAVKKKMQGILDFFAETLNRMIAVANKLPGFQMRYVFSPELGQSENTALERLRELSKEVSGQLQKDFDLAAYAERINNKAKGFSEDRMKDEWSRKTETHAERGKGKIDPGGKAGTGSGGRLSEFERGVMNIEKRTAAIRAQMQAVGASSRETERAAAMQELLSDAQRSGLDVTPQLLSDMDRLARAYADVAAEADLLQVLQNTKRENEDLQNEINLTGLYGFELERARKEMELLNEAKRLGADLTPDKKEEISALAEQNARLQEAQKIIADVRDQSRDALKGFITDIRDGTSATEALSNALMRMSDKLIDMGVNGLVESALGPLVNSGGSGGGLLSGLASLFGGTGYATGGIVRGAGTGTSDSIPARLSNGEFVVNADATRRNRAVLEAINTGAIAAFSKGGAVGAAAHVPNIVAPTAAASLAAPQMSVSVTINAPNATPDGVDAMNKTTVPQLRAMISNVLDEKFSRSDAYQKMRNG